jgi:hypothetical protein
MELVHANDNNVIQGSFPLTPIRTLQNSSTFSGEESDTLSFSLLTKTIPPENLVLGDKYYLRLRLKSNENLDTAVFKGGYWYTAQYPNELLPVTPSTASASQIWGYYDSTNYPYVITSSNSSLIATYGNPEIKQKDISGSGFNPITLPWSIKYGDEFRFEGREDFTFIVGKIFGPAESGSARITQTGSIEVHFHANLPVSASSLVFNLDHFLIRRYVDDASQILFEGFKPINSTGPYLVSPEYVVSDLNKNVDSFIVDLTQKGLL